MGYGHYQLRIGLEILRKTMSPAAFERYQRMLFWATIVPFAVPGIYYGLPWIVSFARKHLDQDWFALATGLIAAVAGWLLFKLRQQQRLAYGSLEIAFASWSALLVGKNLHDPSTQPAVWAALAGSVYVMVRGLDNFVQGFEELRALTRKLKETEEIGEGLVVVQRADP